MTFTRVALQQGITIIAMLLIWQTIAVVFSPQHFPRLEDITTAWAFHWFDGTLKHDLFTTLLRVLVSFVLAMVAGVVSGILLGHFRRADRWFDPILLFFLNLPALVTIILCYIWVGLEEAAAILAVFINKLPTVMVAMREGARVIDTSLLDVAKVYKVSPIRTLTKVYLPQLYPYMLTAARNGLALIWKIVLVVELLGRSDGIGFSLHSLFQFFDIAGILAYTLSFMFIVMLIDWLAFKPVERVIQRGRQT